MSCFYHCSQIPRKRREATVHLLIGPRPRLLLRTLVLTARWLGTFSCGGLIHIVAIVTLYSSRMIKWMKQILDKPVSCFALSMGIIHIGN